MSLTSGTRLGPYEIAASIGAGGMGEVYKARDSRLGRDVAIKILRADVAGDVDRRTRFEREARVIAALNHPHICALFDVRRETPDDRAHAQPIDFLVMEFIDGETLAERLVRQASRSGIR